MYEHIIMDIYVYMYVYNMCPRVFIIRMYFGMYVYVIV